MNRNEAFKVAQANHAERSAAEIAAIHAAFAARTVVDYDAQDAIAEQKWGYRLGWYIVGGFSFSESEVSGVGYDVHQSGWAWV